MYPGCSLSRPMGHIKFQVVFNKGQEQQDPNLKYETIINYKLNTLILSFMLDNRLTQNHDSGSWIFYY